jgi:methionine synthase II (cobalamin-independent)
LEPFAATGIGSVPFSSPEEACREILSYESIIPFWPQLVRKDPREDMGLQYSPPLPCLKPDLAQKTLYYDLGCNRSNALLSFYEKFLERDFPYFSLRPDFASGYYQMVELLSTLNSPASHIKGQIVGPITLGLSTKISSDRFLIHDGELMDVVIKGLAMQAIDQAKKFESLGKSAIIFFDEPSLSGYGSAFTPLSKKEVLEYLGDLIHLIREETSAQIGLHCCGNTDWALLLSLDLDILNFDAYGFGDALMLYPAEIKAFLEKGKTMAWGIVPTTDYTGAETASILLDKLDSLFKILTHKGIDQDRLFLQAMITPACGLGTLSEETARRLLALLSEASLMGRERFSGC